ncbi:MAG: FecR domain-containing protein [gamma proteobacterium symbiont of Bathyaustriella thionipta]|nr:FecR domain-containing protein [gamma proteobacterium symbiont of Bathyaustriella thionipta]MCU7948891.1 FecR domain-containing protein [gamma proteobacterium symbiont of Bathyaustriella thionipta]MCU7952393.1 FecR domain-containing protein [gamma proteobacterium symbiont of Bathyaustriella thionipta]MCU7955348.1 FecR domain-containing protein [gamma proteobacterium symbiont of Bathyaustriella thionipta]MCU7966104.1 FecR domain-containing protein [gamma proteobacterium symbiont of Bathyaustr
MLKKILITSVIHFVFFANQALAENWLYTFKPGDTIWDFSHESLTDWRNWKEIVKLNNIKNEYVMHPGSQIAIPVKWVKQRASKINVINIHGNVQVQLFDSKRILSLKPGMRISKGDIITTDKNSNALLIFEDETKLTLHEESVLLITTARIMGGNKISSSDIQAQIKKGRVNIHANPDKLPDNRFEILTTAGNSAVRGTQFRVSTDNKITKTEVLSGYIDVSNPQGTTKLPAGFGTIAAVGKKPLPPINLLSAPKLNQLDKHIRYLPARFTFAEKQQVSAYRVQIVNQQDPDSIVFDQIIKRTLTIIQDLPDGLYTLKVRAIDEQGLEGKGASHLFQIDARPVAPFQQKPDNKHTQQIGEVNFKWSSPLDSSHYLLEIATQTDFAQKKTIQHKVSNSSHRVLLDEAGTYYWRISSVDNTAHQGPPSDLSLIHIIPVPRKPEMEQPSISDDHLILR